VTPSRSPSADTRAPKEERIAFRASKSQRELIKQASTVASTTMSDFILESSLAPAQDVLADRRAFHLAPEQWDAFVALLDRRPLVKPRLQRLLSEASVLERS